MSVPHDGLTRHGVIEAVITLGAQTGAGRIQSDHGLGLVYFEPTEWLGDRSPRPGARVRYVHRGRNQATRVTPELGAPEPLPDAPEPGTP